jgi:hypothetical protein
LEKWNPVDLIGDMDALVIRVNPGQDRVSCVVEALDFADGRSHVDARGVGTGKTTYLLIELVNVPALKTNVHVNLLSGSERYTVPMVLQTPEQGRLKLTVTSDDTGEPTPAMVRLVWKDTGRDYRPRNAIEFAPQFDTQGQATGRRNAVLMGKLQGPYWCVPGPVDMTLPPGQWEATVRRGTEHVSVVDAFEVKSGGVVERTYRPKRWVDMREHGWWSGDDHVHCQLLSDHDIRNLMAWVVAEDVHLANVLKMGDIMRTWFEQRGFGKEYRVREDDYILVPGQECPRTHEELGHTISLNITSMVRDTTQYYLYDRMHEEIHAQGGLWGFAHVNSGIFEVHRGMTLEAPEDAIDFVELLQFANLGTDLYYEFLDLGFKVTASAGSDVPWGGTVGEVRLYAYLGDQPFTADAWFAAVDSGRTFVTNGPMVEFRVNGALPGDEVQIDGEKPVRITARAWGHPEFAAPTKLEIVQFGNVIQETTTASADGALELDFEWAPGDGGWIAARVESAEGYRAHTTPVYVVREGLRFWDYANVETQLANRRESLDQIEGVIADAVAAHERGEAAMNPAIYELALQADDLRERVAEARTFYDGLEATHKAEAEKRND